MEQRGLKGLLDDDVELYSLLCDDEHQKIRTELFGFHVRPANAVSRFGHFLPKELDEEVEAAGLRVFNWRYWKSAGYWSQMHAVSVAVQTANYYYNVYYNVVLQRSHHTLSSYVVVQQVVRV